ncbi:MAG: hypothetical protein Q9185_000329 [Variospora sp. 1 TL-2023]
MHLLQLKIRWQGDIVAGAAVTAGKIVVLAKSSPAEWSRSLKTRSHKSQGSIHVGQAAPDNQPREEEEEEIAVAIVRKKRVWPKE